jgi:hypothetical protein
MHMCMWDSTSLELENNINYGSNMFCILARFPYVLVFKVSHQQAPLLTPIPIWIFFLLPQ